MTDGSITAVGTEMRSYYGRPILKEPVWQPEIPWYLFTGGLAGASSFLGRLARRRGNHELADAALWISLAGDAVSPLLLVSDLGRPERFHHMLRVFKVTSPMNVGSWILAGSGAASTAAAAAHVLGLRRVRDAAETVSALLGLPLATYTAVLVSDTAIPVWHEARRELPLVFGASSAATAGAAAAMAVEPDAAGPARRIAIAGALAELGAFEVMERRLGMVGEPYRREAAGTYAKLAKGLAAAGAAVLGIAGRRRIGAVAGGSLVLAGEICLRWSVFRAGFQSARDPRYTVEPQRARIGASD
jgi:formate-dependent nitrite reductase membrane component NrfD